jgi:hypothetical protein
MSEGEGRGATFIVRLPLTTRRLNHEGLSLYHD